MNHGAGENHCDASTNQSAERIRQISVQARRISTGGNRADAPARASRRTSPRASSRRGDSGLYIRRGPANLDAGDTPIRTVRLSELFSAPNRSLVVYQFMFGKKNTTPCPMFTLWIDGWNGVAHHLAQNVDFAIVAAADPVALRAHGRARGWDRLRLPSCGANTFKYDLGSEDREGIRIRPSPFSLEIMTKPFVTSTQLIRLSSSDIKERGIDLLCPVWHILDLTPQGRGEWYADLGYGTNVSAARH